MRETNDREPTSPIPIGARLREEVAGWPGVSLQPHRFGGIEFTVNGKEIGHAHGDYLVDLPLPKAARDEALAAGMAVPHHVLPASNWVSVYLRTEADGENAFALLRLNYDRLVGRSG